MPRWRSPVVAFAMSGIECCSCARNLLRSRIVLRVGRLKLESIDLRRGRNGPAESGAAGGAGPGRMPSSRAEPLQEVTEWPASVLAQMPRGMFRGGRGAMP